MQTLFLTGEWAMGTFWAFVPAIIAIALALITKQVYLSLFAGIFVGSMLLANGNPIHALGTIFEVMSAKIDVGILAFLIVLGIIVILLQKSGGSKAYGDWASDKIKTKSGALAATSALGCLIFVDDYFNCLTVGSVMRPVTDKFGVSRAKLAYIIDATAAPVCIIAPISSWASAVGSQIDGNGLIVFIQTIPFNLYALLTIAFVFYMSLSSFDFGKMRANEMAAASGDLLAGETDLPTEDVVGIESNPNGKVRYLIIPIIILIVTCIVSMSYVGFFYDWGSTLDVVFDKTDVLASQIIGENGIALSLNNTTEVLSVLENAGIGLATEGAYYTVEGGNIVLTMMQDVTHSISDSSVSLSMLLTSEGLSTVFQGGTIIDSFANTNSSLALAIGSTLSLIIIMGYYIIAKVVNFKSCMESLTEGFKSMVPAILILVFAWTIGGIMGAKGGHLNAKLFIETILASGSFPLWLLPFIFFVLACIISFSTGTSWGTFAVLIPLATAFYMPEGAETVSGTVPVFLLVAAILSGGVFGDHISPISDTTIMASSGAQCNHVDHVKTQLPYAGLIACIAGVSYLVLGAILQNVKSYILGVVITLGMGFALLVGAIVVIKILQAKKAKTPMTLPETDSDPV